jgi:hypothetical protein
MQPTAAEAAHISAIQSNNSKHLVSVLVLQYISRSALALFSHTEVEHSQL